MTKSLLAIVSSQPRLLSELPALLADRFQLLVCESIEEAEELLPGRPLRGLLADFHDVGNDGQRAGSLLSSVLEPRPDLDLIVLTRQDCPAAVRNRLADANHALHLIGDHPPADLATLLADRMDQSQESEASSEDTDDEDSTPDGDLGAETVLTGITRDFQTNSPRMKKMLGDLEIAARHNVTILLIGETGSGKTFLSKLIHEVSPRRESPFLHVACGALPSELIESELFGHSKGSFTSAHADKEGKFVAAADGTVLLDEIDVLGPEQQVKLLKVIETGEFEPVGSNITLRSQARLVVASNLQLQPLVESGRFRPDLYYRLNMLKFEILPLRDRTCDIKPLAKKFVRQHATKHQVSIRRIDRSLYEALQLYPWPGNVRELENVIQRAVIYCEDGVLTSGHLPEHIIRRTAGPTNDASVRLGTAGESEPETLEKQIQLTEREIIEQALFNNNFSRTKTAKELGISRVTLYNKMKKYGM